MLLEACPRAAGALRDRIAVWDREATGLYTRAGDIAVVLVDQVARDEADEVAAAFDVIELVMGRGYADARDLAGIGILEDVQTRALSRGIDSEVFERWLGPRSMEAWRESELRWQGNDNLMDVFRSRGTGEA